MECLDLKTTKNPIDEDETHKLLEQISINERTLVATYDIANKSISMVLFHLTEQPNQISKLAAESTWGYTTHFVDKMMTEKEAAEVVGLFLKDIENENFWWEKQ